jgi:hypothetical protein
MVVVFVGCLCCCGLTRDITSSSYVKKWYKNNLKMRLTVLLSDPPLRAPYPLDRPEYVRIKLADIPQELIDEYKLNKLARDSWVYYEMRHGMDGL